MPEDEDETAGGKPGARDVPPRAWAAHALSYAIAEVGHEGRLSPCWSLSADRAVARPDRLPLSNPRTVGLTDCPYACNQDKDGIQELAPDSNPAAGSTRAFSFESHSNPRHSVW